MSEVTITYCDLCNLDQQFLADEDRKQVRSAFGMETVVSYKPYGWFSGPFEDARTDGWEERDYGHVCPKCVAAEKAQAALDEKEGAFSYCGLELPEED